jgi:nucleoid-associated protein EbfC
MKNIDQMKQLMEMKREMDRIQKEMEKTLVTGDGGKGAVIITMNGTMKVKEVKISDEMLEPKNHKKLEENVLKATNDAIDKAQKEAAKQLKDITGGLKIPGL